MGTIYHMVHYRRFEAEPEGSMSETLEDLCRTALNSENGTAALWSRPEDRIFDVGDSDGRRVFLNKIADLSSAVFGEMCLAQAKDVQALLQLQATSVKLSDFTIATVYDLDEREAPVGSQFIRGLAYWLAIGNHVFFVKTHSMTPEFIRLYFEWFIKTHTKTVLAQTITSLNAQLDKSKGAKDIGDIRRLRVSGKAAPQMAVSVPDASGERIVKTQRRLADKFAQMLEAVPIVLAIFGKERTEALIQSLGPGEYLAVEASVGVRGARTETARRQMQDIATNLANSSDAQVQIEGKDGRVSDGDAILRTNMPFNLPYEGSNLLDFDNVADQLQQVYARFVKDGKIEA